MAPIRPPNRERPTIARGPEWEMAGRVVVGPPRGTFKIVAFILNFIVFAGLGTLFIGRFRHRDQSGLCLIPVGSSSFPSAGSVYWVLGEFRKLVWGLVRSYGLAPGRLVVLREADRNALKRSRLSETPKSCLTNRTFGRCVHSLTYAITAIGFWKGPVDPPCFDAQLWS